MSTFLDIQKWYAILVIMFGASRGHEIFIETKCEVCYMIENFSLSTDFNFFLYGVLKFTTRSCFTWTAMRDDGQSLQQCEIKSGCMSGRVPTFEDL